jgi:rare lipoprotein A
MRFTPVLSVALLCVLAACAGGPGGGGRSGGSMASGAGVYKVGNAYSVQGQRYYPKEDYGYEETGIASWYGPGFSGGRTANGEVFDPTELTAAHRTLPMPSLVRVTNLDNGRSVVVRVNDRGPFAAGRIIDLSQRSAQLLGFEKNGTAKVKVAILASESRAIADQARKRYKAEGVQVADIAPQAAPQDTADQQNDMPPAPIITPVTDNPGEAPDAAPRETVEAVPLEPLSVAANAEGPVTPSEEQPIANPSENVIKSAELAPEIPDPKPETVPGSVKKGVFYPSEKVTQVKVAGSHRIFVQAGAFSNKANAVKLQTRLSSLGPSSISEADVNGTHFFRVRVGPVESVQEADGILKQVLGGGTKAKITVE